MKGVIVFGFLMITSIASSQVVLSLGTRDSFPWFKLDRLPNLDTKFKQSTKSTYQGITYDQSNGWIRDSMFYLKNFNVWERLLAAGKGSPLISSNLVKSAKRKYPGNSTNSAVKRHAMYHRTMLNRLR